MPDSYPFTTYSGLLEPKHYKQIGTALWFFLWCISSTTKEEEVDGVTWGLVLGNRPMKLSELAAPFEVDDKTVSRWLKTLETYHYIKITRAPYGLIIAVKNSKKWRERSDKNVRSDEREQTNLSDLSPRDQTNLSDLNEREQTNLSDLSPRDQTKMSDLNGENGQICLISPERSDKNVRSNKDIKDLKDITTTTITFRDPNFFDSSSQDPLIQVIDSYCKLHKRLDIHIRQQERGIMGRMIAGGVPSPFIIQTMTKLYDEKRRREEESGRVFSPPSTFKYYEQAIYEAWNNGPSSITAEVSSSSVALGSPGRRLVTKSRYEQNNDYLKRAWEEAQREQSGRTEALFDHE
ncbi:hypothetical protein [Paenibacillus rigui]|uniref:hypothetical protein n=1 Tax=Paenibacillus rigui TaxID=554312 RepID=UPI0015C5D0C3|nr:hypothetical protein [Paenibacillus rigui]